METAHKEEQFDLRRMATEFCHDEYADYIAYKRLVSIEFNKERKKKLEVIAKTEHDHFDFWKKYSFPFKPSLKSILYSYFLMLLRLIFGVTFAIKLLERGEEKAVERYRTALDLMQTEEDKKAVERIIQDELEHERYFVSQLDEVIVKYMSALVLGLADAIIEITGTHAGTLGTTNSTIITGAVGLVVGISAAISMASASYLQTKHETGKSPTIAALITGSGYILAVALMSLPYFILNNILLAFVISIAISILLVMIFTFQGSVYTNSSFIVDFLQTVGLVLGVALLAYFLGDILSATLGIRGLIK
ncbi:MAG: VIT1/CCC1 transporter family protein [Candidatus Methanodesulfokora sp.]